MQKFKQRNVITENSHLSINSIVHNGHHVMTFKPEILMISTYPPRECGIATYTHDLTQALISQFGASMTPRICALENSFQKHQYDAVVKYTLQTDDADSYVHLSRKIDLDDAVELIVIQHEFGLFAKQEEAFFQLLYSINKPVIVVFHTVLPQPDPGLRVKIKIIARYAASIVVMTNTSVQILTQDYQIDRKQIQVIAHGTHLVDYPDKMYLKRKYALKDRLVLSTFGLLSQGKNIEMTLHAMPEIIKHHPEVVFLVLGKTHPDVFKEEEDLYSQRLRALAQSIHIENHIRFVSHYLPTAELLEYLQLTDVYLFTSKDPNQAVSGTFSYALSCGCPIVSTPIPHAREVLSDGAGIIVDFNDSRQLAIEVNQLLDDQRLRQSISINAVQKMAVTAWENSAIAHAQLFMSYCRKHEDLEYAIPKLNYKHIQSMTDDFGLIQFSKLNQVDISSGYTLDDNARALIAMCMEYEIRPMDSTLKAITKYLHFLKFCYTESGVMLNYVNKHRDFSEQNKKENLEDANGRAIWALGYVIGLAGFLPDVVIAEARVLFGHSMRHAQKMHSTRAMAFTLKGLYYKNISDPSVSDIQVMEVLADRLVQMYSHESDNHWKWFESYITYANAVLPEALLCAAILTDSIVYKTVAQATFDFLLDKTFSRNQISVITNKGWLHKGIVPELVKSGAEQPIDVAYSIIALRKFSQVFPQSGYYSKLVTAFSWFNGNNHLNQIVYNPCTGGCYDGLEQYNINLNQGAESTVSYLISRLVIEMAQSERHHQKQRASQFLEKFIQTN